MYIAMFGTLGKLVRDIRWALWLAGLVWHFHTLLLGLFLTGPFHPIWMMRWTVWLYPLTLGAWKLNSGRCILTDLENYLRGRGPGEQFIRPMLARVGIEITEKTNENMMFLLLVPWAACCWHLVY